MKFSKDFLVHLIQSLTHDLSAPDPPPDPVTPPTGLDLSGCHILKVTVKSAMLISFFSVKTSRLTILVLNVVWDTSILGRTLITIEINNKFKCNFIDFFFPKIIT